LLGLFFNLEDRVIMLLRNVGSFSTDFTALYPRAKGAKQVVVDQGTVYSPHPKPGKNVCEVTVKDKGALILN
jgi:hypothetical protein